ncbi:hypothetical protein [Sphingobacterium bambusae]|uniref:Uncharacterized protein n=1 Tax=Sphingobacterium bambusae TaxID=662858 RepID=A0ABW6BJ38_9SPHI|nr:hypothetical protein [Sphingobacterium bambusae]WPL49689.1 hypothetical protein SCB77_04390 [Sphingobacterium bambusae]
MMTDRIWDKEYRIQELEQEGRDKDNLIRYADSTLRDNTEVEAKKILNKKDDMGKNTTIVLLGLIVIALIVNLFFGIFNGDCNDMIAAEAVDPKTDTIPLTRGTTPSGNSVVSYTPREGIIPSNNITAAYNNYVQDTLGPAPKIKASDINDPDGRDKGADTDQCFGIRPAERG